LLHPLAVLSEELDANPSYRNIRKLGLVGSSGLLKSRLVDGYFAARGYEVVTLGREDQEKYFMQPVYQGAKTGRVDAQSRRLFVRQFEILREAGADVIVGACSEVPLLAGDATTIPGLIDLFDLTARHIVNNYHFQPLCDTNTDCSSAASATTPIR
jgi:aspartate racemase